MINALRRLLGLNYYISELDTFLNHYRHDHASLSPATRAEKAKYARVHDLRDHPAQIIIEKKLWDKF